jgi:hypothetical protein
MFRMDGQALSATNTISSSQRRLALPEALLTMELT